MSGGRNLTLFASEGRFAGAAVLRGLLLQLDESIRARRSASAAVHESPVAAGETLRETGTIDVALEAVWVAAGAPLVVRGPDNTGRPAGRLTGALAIDSVAIGLAPDARRDVVSCRDNAIQAVGDSSARAIFARCILAVHTGVRLAALPAKVTRANGGHVGRALAQGDACAVEVEARIAATKADIRVANSAHKAIGVVATRALCVGVLDSAAPADAGVVGVDRGGGGH